LRAQLIFALAQLGLVETHSSEIFWLGEYIRSFRFRKHYPEDISKSERKQARHAIAHVVAHVLTEHWSFPEDYRAFREYSRMLSEGPQERILTNPSRYIARSWKKQTLFTMSQTTRLKLQKVRTNANWHGLAPVRSVRKNPCRRSLITYRKQQESLGQAKDMFIDFVCRVGSKREATQSGSPVQGLSASVHCRK